MKRKDAIETIVSALNSRDAIVSTTGLISREIFEKFDSERNIYVPGSMGLASSIGLGIAVSRPEKRVIVIDGDASLLMNLGSIVTIGYRQPNNLLHIVFDNGAFASCSEEISMSNSAKLDKLAQKAFFDCFAGGHDLLKGVVRYSHKQFPGIPIIIDCKIGDTKNTMHAYLNNLFVNMDVDGIVVNPYMGDDVLEPFRDFPGKMAVVLVRTSNSGASIIQDMMTASGKKLWEVVLDLMINRWNTADNMVPVMSSTAQMDLQSVRKAIPDSMNILFAGVGKQGGNESGVRLLLNSKQSGVFVNSSRGILYAHSHGEQQWQEAVVDAVIRLRNSLNKHRRY